MIMESVSTSSSSSPSIGLVSNDGNESISIASEELRNGDVMNAIKLLTNYIDFNNFQFKNNNINNNNNTDNSNNSINNSNNSCVDNDLRAKELSQLYAIRSESYLKLGLHQLAFDDSQNGIQFNKNNENCYYFKGCALLGLNQRESAEQAFQMALEINQNHSEASEELVKIRYEALKEAGFDEETANRFAPKSKSVNDAIDAILSRSLTANELSDLRASYTRNLSNSNQFSQQISSLPLMSNNFGSNYSNKSAMESSSGPNNSASEIGLKLISDIDNCLGSILDSDEESKVSDENQIKNSATFVNNKNENFCDIGDNNLMSRSLSPQSSKYFGINFSNQSKTNHNFAIDLNKDSLGSQIVPKNVNRSEKSFIPPRKTFADIASTNADKPVKQPKVSIFDKKTITNGKNIDNNIETNNILGKSPQKNLENSGNKISSLESFSIPNTINNTNNSDENISSTFLVNNTDIMKPSNIMGYKGLWVCNISPDVSYITLKKVFRKYGNFTGIQTFERKATNGSNIVFVHYDNSQSPSDAISELFGIYRKDICFDEMTPLKLRFTPSMEQTKSGDLPSMEKAKRVVEKSGECFNWRLSSGCHKGDRCPFRHILINKSIDSQPWVKALKKKANEA